MQHSIRYGAIGVSALMLAGTVAAHAQFIQQLEVYRGQKYQQTGTTVTPLASNPYAFQAKMTPMSVDMASDPTMKLPGGSTQAMTEEGYGFVLYGAYATSAALTAAYPDGNYTFSFSFPYVGTQTASLALASGTFPAAPQVSNLTQAQSVDATADFTLNWGAYSGAGANDVIRLVITSPDGNNVVDSYTPMDAPLMNNVTSYRIDAETLAANTTYNARLIFYKLNIKTHDEIFGLYNYSGYFAETAFTIKTIGSGGGDTTPPTLVTSDPANNETDVNGTFATVTFQFNEPMAEKQSIQWTSSSGALASFTYAWSDDQTLRCIYMGTMPSGATIQWTLNPTAGGANNFCDVAGNGLAVNTFKGQFTVAGGGNTNNPCGDTNETDRVLTYSISKHWNYKQASDAAPVFDASEYGGATFSAMVAGPQDLTSASVKAPGAASATPLEVIPYTDGTNRTAYFFASFTNNATEVNTAYPFGTYTISASGSGSVGSVNISFPDDGKPPVPQVNNFTAAQSVNPDADFTLLFNGISSPKTNDWISIVITDGTNIVFQLPDACDTVQLTNTATSVVIPKGTIKTGIVYRATLSYSHIAGSGPVLYTGGDPGWATVMKSTDFTIKTGGTTPTAPKILSYKRLSKSQLEVQVQCNTSASLVIQKATALPTTTWTTLLTTNATSSPMTLVLPVGTDARTFFRAAQ